MAIYAGKLYVTDFHNNRVQEFDGEGKFVAWFGGYGTEKGQLWEPWGIAADSNGDIYVSDKGPDIVEEFDPTGKFVAWVGSGGKGAEQFENPTGLATDSSGDLYVAEWQHRIDKWLAVNQGPHVTQTIYYSAGSNGSLPKLRRASRMGKHAVSGAAGQTAGNGRPSDPGCHGIQIQCMGRAGSYYQHFWKRLTTNRYPYDTH